MLQAIRLNAVKNEEVLQIDKLKAEIKELRLKLSERQENSGGIDTLAEQRFSAQIREYEGMLRQTWEDKAELSRSLEAEREKILNENRQHQAVVEKEMSQERLRRLQLLEQKDDLMLTVRELGLDMEGEEQWVSDVEGAVTLCEEAKRGEAVLTMYEADLEEAVNHWCKQCEHRHQAVIAAMSQQLRTKVANLHSEAAGFVTLRSQVGDHRVPLVAQLMCACYAGSCTG